MLDVLRLWMETDETEKEKLTNMKGEAKKKKRSKLAILSVAQEKNKTEQKQ